MAGWLTGRSVGWLAMPNKTAMSSTYGTAISRTVYFFIYNSRHNGSALLCSLCLSAVCSRTNESDDRIEITSTSTIYFVCARMCAMHSAYVLTKEKEKNSKSSSSSSSVSFHYSSFHFVVGFTSSSALLLLLLRIAGRHSNVLSCAQPSETNVANALNRTVANERIERSQTEYKSLFFLSIFHEQSLICVYNVVCT